jgi:hypothetical protein
MVSGLIFSLQDQQYSPVTARTLRPSLIILSHCTHILVRLLTFFITYDNESCQEKFICDCKMWSWVTSYISTAYCYGTSCLIFSFVLTKGTWKRDLKDFHGAIWRGILFKKSYKIFIILQTTDYLLANSSLLIVKGFLEQYAVLHVILFKRC